MCEIAEKWEEEWYGGPNEGRPILDSAAAGAVAGAGVGTGTIGGNQARAAAGLSAAGLKAGAASSQQASERAQAREEEALRALAMAICDRARWAQTPLFLLLLFLPLPLLLLSIYPTFLSPSLLAPLPSSTSFYGVFINPRRELSLDKKTDSPFALLAKENDILWSGGMPDDCAVVCLRVVTTQQELEK